MKARTRKWVVLSALALLSLDFALVAVAVPRAQGWLESARASALVRAGTAAWRGLENPAARGVADFNASLLTRFTHRSTSVYAIVLQATPHRVPREAAVRVAREAGVRAAREARWVMVETRCERATAAEVASGTIAPECPSSSCPSSSCPSSSCPSSSCPKTSTPRGTASGPSTTGLPTSMMGITLE